MCHYSQGEGKKGTNEENSYRETSLVHNRKNSRKDGQILPRRTKTYDSMVCNFALAVKWDKFGFYVELERRAGCPMHCNHPQLFDQNSLPFPTRLLTQDQVKNTKGVMEATCNKAAGRNFLHNTFG